MNDSVDANKIAAEVLTGLIRQAFSNVSSQAKSTMKNAWAKIFEDFVPYMQECYKKNSCVRILSQKDSDVDLYSVYVNSLFKSKNKIFNDEELIYSIREGRNVIINGNGGAGKTFFMRHLWMNIFKESGQFTPIFIELRRLNDLTSFDLKSFIRASISRKKELDDSLFSYFCDIGRFCFILDGFDEIVLSHREAAQTQILQLSSDYPNCRFVVSSRYESRFAGWQNFDLFESQPFDLERVRKLIDLVPFDHAAKKVFIKKLNKEFYNENESFLSNPLLAIMMMMTFKENMDIPRRMNIFYEQAYTTLYQWHDATKAFSREKSLDIDEFKRSFSTFCLLSYFNEKFEFTKSEIIEYIVKSNQQCGISTDPEDVLRDYEENVNLLKQDGLNYVFIHRSFQEYFFSYAAIVMNPDKFGAIFKKVKRRFDDNILLMCYEMNKSIVIDSYLELLFKKMDSIDLFIDKNLKEFQILSIFDMSLSFFIGRRAPDGSHNVSTISFSIDENVDEFINNVGRLMGLKIPGLNFSGHMIFNDINFNEIESKIKNERIKSNFRCFIKFQPEKITAEYSLENDNSFSKEELDDMSEKMVSAFKKEFFNLECNIRNEIAKMYKWCSTEIESNKSRGASLDEILSL